MYQYAKKERRKEKQIIQRKVGMEFQTVEGEPNIIKSGRRKVIPFEDNIILRRNGFTVTCDGNDLEYVTEPVDPVTNLVTIVQHIVFFHDNIYKSVDNADKKEILTTLDEHGYVLNLLGEQTAHPQASMGVRMEKIDEFIKMVLEPEENIPKFGCSIPNSQNSTIQRDVHSVIYKEIEQKLAGENPNTKGFIQLFFQYYASTVTRAIIKKNAIKHGGIEIKMKYAKSFLPIMSRTSLYNLYQLLGRDGARAIEIIESYIGENTSDSSEASDSSGKQSTESIMKKLLHEEETNIFMERGDAEGMETAPCIMFGEMLDDLKAGKDLIAERRLKGVSELYKPAEGATSLEEAQLEYRQERMQQVFQMASPTEISANPQIEGAIIELRALERKVQPDKWVEIATHVDHLAKWAES